MNMPALGAGKHWKQISCLSVALCEAGRRKTLNAGHSVAGKDLLNDNWMNSIINRIIRTPALGPALNYAGLRGRQEIQLIIVCRPYVAGKMPAQKVGKEINIHNKCQK